MSKVIKVVSVSYFILPLLSIFKKKLIVSFQYDYKTNTNKDFGGMKGLTAGLREYLSIKSANVIIATTEELKTNVKQNYGKEAIIIPNFVDIAKFFPLEKEKYIFYAGRIYWHKGIDYLIEAFGEVEKKYPDYKLKLAGIGDLENYKTKANGLRIQKIEFLGTVDNSKISEVMGRAEIFVLPTVTREGHPKALIEAMACGCACIATDVPGNNNLIQDGENGLLVKSKDSGAIASAIIKILKNENLRTKLSTGARKTAEGFAIDNTLHKEIKLLQDMIMKVRESGYQAKK